MKKYKASLLTEKKIATDKLKNINNSIGATAFFKENIFRISFEKKNNNKKQIRWNTSHMSHQTMKPLPGTDMLGDD